MFHQAPSGEKTDAPNSPVIGISKSELTAFATPKMRWSYFDKRSSVIKGLIKEFLETDPVRLLPHDTQIRYKHFYEFMQRKGKANLLDQLDNTNTTELGLFFLNWRQHGETWNDQSTEHYNKQSILMRKLSPEACLHLFPFFSHQDFANLSLTAKYLKEIVDSYPPKLRHSALWAQRDYQRQPFPIKTPLELDSDIVVVLADGSIATIDIIDSKFTKHILIIDPRTGNHLDKLETNGDFLITKLQIISATHLLSFCSDNTLRLWNLKERQQVCLQGHTAEVNLAICVQNGTLASACAGDNTLRIWDAHTGICLKTYDISNLTTIDNIQLRMIGLRENGDFFIVAFNAITWSIDTVDIDISSEDATQLNIHSIQLDKKFLPVEGDFGLTEDGNHLAFNYIHYVRNINHEGPCLLNMTTGEITEISVLPPDRNNPCHSLLNGDIVECVREAEIFIMDGKTGECKNTVMLSREKGEEKRKICMVSPLPDGKIMYVYSVDDAAPGSKKTFKIELLQFPQLKYDIPPKLLSTDAPEDDIIPTTSAGL